MRELATARVDATPALVLTWLTDIGRLPECNHAITEVLEQPSHLIPGAVWKVRLHALGQSWVSKSTLIEHDEAQDFSGIARRPTTATARTQTGSGECNLSALARGSL
jgi:hypothetical protein